MTARDSASGLQPTTSSATPGEMARVAGVATGPVPGGRWREGRGTGSAHGPSNPDAVIVSRVFETV